MNQQLIDKIARTPQSQIFIFALVLTIFRLVVFPYLKKQPVYKQGATYKFLAGISDLFDALIYAAVFIFLVIRPYFFQTFTIPSGSMVPTMLVGDYIVLNKAIYRYSEPKRGDIVVFRPPAYACNPEQLLPDGTVNADFVKRLVGMPGDLLEIRQGQIFVNGQSLYEPYKQLTEPTNATQTQFRVLNDTEKAIYPKADWKLVKDGDRYIPLNFTEFDANEYPPRSNGPMPYSTVPEFVQHDPTEWARLKSLPAQKIPAGHFLFMGDNRNGSSDGRAWGLIERGSIVGRAEFIWLPISRIGKPRYVDNGTKPLPNAIVPDAIK
jgi:signal peptidase I